VGKKNFPKTPAFLFFFSGQSPTPASCITGRLTNVAPPLATYGDYFH